MKTDLYKSYFDISFQYVYLFECSLIYIHDLKLKSKKDFFYSFTYREKKRLYAGLENLFYNSRKIWILVFR